MVFKSSSSLRQFPVLKNYQMVVEECVSRYVSEFSVWAKKRRTDNLAKFV